MVHELDIESKLETEVYGHVTNQLTPSARRKRSILTPPQRKRGRITVSCVKATKEKIREREGCEVRSSSL